MPIYGDEATTPAKPQKWETRARAVGKGTLDKRIAALHEQDRRNRAAGIFPHNDPADPWADTIWRRCEPGCYHTPTTPKD